MKPNIHPAQHQVLVQCVCNNEFYFYTSLESKIIHIEVCNQCHPFFTGKQQVVATAGRVENFNNKFNNFRDKNVNAAPANNLKPKTTTNKSKVTSKSQPKNKSATN